MQSPKYPGVKMCKMAYHTMKQWTWSQWIPCFPFVHHLCRRWQHILLLLFLDLLFYHQFGGRGPCVHHCTDAEDDAVARTAGYTGAPKIDGGFAHIFGDGDGTGLTASFGGGGGGAD
eukprot:2314054-Amphidinium_carterae.1